MSRTELLQLTANSVDVSGVPKEIKILSLGKINSQKGDFIVDNESFNNMNRFFKERNIDMVVDYEHQTLKDVQAPAAGWIKELTLKNNGIFANVEWTPKAQDYLKNKEYRYLSPVVMVRKTDSKALILNSVALTNMPAINGMEAIINSLKGDGNMEEDNTNDLKEIAKSLELGEDATKDDIIEAIEKLKNNTPSDEGKGEDLESSTKGVDTIANKLQNFYKMKESDDIIQKALSLSIIEKDQKEWAFNQCINNDNNFIDLVNRLFKEKANELVMKALHAGKITPAQKPWAEKYVLKDYEGFETFLSKATKVVPLGAIKYLKDDLKVDTQTEEATNISKMLNVSEEDLQKYDR